MVALTIQGSGGGVKNHCRSEKALRAAVFVALRNAFYAAAARIFIGVLKRIGKGGLRMEVFRKLSGEIFSLDPLKWAFLVASLSCFRLFKRIIRAFGEYFGISDKVAAAISGVFCALPALVMNRETQTDLCLYCFLRALHTSSLAYILPRLPKPLSEFQHYDILIMCLSASQILYGFVFAPFSMPLSYQQFLLKAAMVDNRLIRGVAGLARYQITPELVELCMEKGLVVPQNPREHFKIGCVYTHLGKTCNQYFVSFLYKNMLQVGLPLYLPLKLLTVIAFQWRLLRKWPFKMLRSIFRSAFSSALFLALYSASPVRLACFAAQGNFRGGLTFAIFCSVAGIAAFLEPKSRRVDLALYCMMYALRSFVMTQYRLGRIPYPRHFLVFLLYVFSVGFLLVEYDQNPEKLHFRLRFFLSKLLERGEEQHSREEAKANESNENSVVIL